MELEFINNEGQDYDKFYESFLLYAKKALESDENYEKYHVSCLITNDEFIHEINRTYRGIDRATDVISFAFLDEDEGLVDSPIIDLGEIIISADRAKEQAKDYGHSLEREMNFLFVHGLLHLLGYNHETKEDEEIMFGLQRKILGDEK